MQLNEIDFKDVQPVDGYGPGFFRVGGALHTGPVLVAGGAPRPWAGLDDPEPLLTLKGKVDVLFVGTGADIAFLPKDLTAKLETNGIGVETMNSPSACRTYNVLLSEGRRVALAALPV